MKKVFALCGSQSQAAANLYLLRVIKAMAADKFDTVLFTALGRLPHFNPDLDGDKPPQTVTLFRQRLQEADGVLICTPEYAMGVPGTLKNSLDWLVSTTLLSKKPTALITASTSGKEAHRSLLETLKILDVKTTTGTQLLLSFIKTKMDREGRLTDEETKEKIGSLINAFAALLQG